MTSLKLTKRIEGSPAEVFRVFSDLERAAERVTGIEKIELLSDGPVGVGTRWRETRIMFKKEATEEMEITAFEPGKGYIVEAESCGAHYTTFFRFRPEGTATEVEVEFQVEAMTFMAKVLSPLGRMMKGTLKKCIDNDLDDLKAVVESATEKAVPTS